MLERLSVVCRLAVSQKRAQRHGVNKFTGINGGIKTNRIWIGHEGKLEIHTSFYNV
jgi:hypothetical protein